MQKVLKMRFRISSAGVINGYSQMLLAKLSAGDPMRDADSGRCRSAFRFDGDRDSDVMPITIPG
jgi:hypothetical protein